MDDLKPSELEAVLSQSSVQSDSLRTREEIKQIHDLMESMKVKKYIYQSFQLSRPCDVHVVF
jgi:hypothetical protein